MDINWYALLVFKSFIDSAVYVCLLDNFESRVWCRIEVDGGVGISYY
jgi:hypothetical protein